MATMWSTTNPLGPRRTPAAPSGGARGATSGGVRSTTSAGVRSATSAGVRGATRPRWARLGGAAAVIATGSLLLAACSQAQDAVSERLNHASCQVITPALESVGESTADLADRISIDPDGAITAIGSMRDSVQRASEGASGRAAEQLDRLALQLDRMILLAESARSGPVDPAQIRDAQDAVTAQVQGLLGAC